MTSKEQYEQLQMIIDEAERKISSIIEKPVNVFYTPKSNYSSADVIRAIKKVMGVTKEQMQERTRKTEIVRARQIFCYLMNKRTNNISMGKITYQFDRHRTTGIHSVDTIKGLLKTNDFQTTVWVSQIEKLINQ